MLGPGQRFATPDGACCPKPDEPHPEGQPPHSGCCPVDDMRPRIAIVFKSSGGRPLLNRCGCPSDEELYAIAATTGMRAIKKAGCLFDGRAGPN
jgi:hypothetical protein